MTEDKTTPDPAKPRLIIQQGAVVMADPLQFPSGDYLRKWQREHGIADGTPIRIMTQEHFADLWNRASIPHIA